MIHARVLVNLPRAEEGRQTWNGIAARGEDEADGRKVVWFYALLSTLQLSSPLSSCDLVRTPWSERPPSQSLLTHPALRVPRSRPQPRPSPAPAPSLPSSIREASLLKPLLHPLIGSVRPHQPPLHREVGPEPRQPDFAPFSPGIAPTPSPAIPNPPKVLSAWPSAASLLPIPLPGVPRSQNPGMHHLQLHDVAGSYRLLPAADPPRATAVCPAFPSSAHSRRQPIRSQWLVRQCRCRWVSAGLYAVGGAARSELRIGWGDVRGR